MIEWKYKREGDFNYDYERLDHRLRKTRTRKTDLGDYRNGVSRSNSLWNPVHLWIDRKYVKEKKQ